MISLLTNYIHFYDVVIGYNSVLYDIRKYSKYHHNKNNNNNKTNKQTNLRQLHFSMKEILISTVQFTELRDHEN